MIPTFLTKFPPTVEFRSDQVKFPEATRQIYGAGWTLNSASLLHIFYYNEQTTYMWCTVHTRDICINSRRGKVQVGVGDIKV